MKIKRRDGTISMVHDDYILADGESYIHSLMLRDGVDDVQRAMAAATGPGLHDGMGNADAQYCRDLQDAWMGKEPREREKEADALPIGLDATEKKTAQPLV
jgi:hypothetical protein